jgi:DNA-directed RNA polymerase specialized sigma24 family protein
MGAPMNRSKTEAMPPNPKRSREPTEDIETLHALLPELNDDGLLAVYMRFWECMTIQEIAKILGRTWDETDQLIECSIRNLRAGFVTRDTNMPTAIAA